MSLLAAFGALQAFVTILRSDRNTQRDDLLADLERWHDMQPVDTPSEGVSHTVEKLVGEAFNRLDSTARLVMQALAIYNFPVPAVAVGWLFIDFPHRRSVRFLR